ncbi:MAG: T9SS type A sorting domain-containing protein, partial [Bacteroidales bacterium]|nr:T9SS type A sorting domain-containing protein [Bacteroidales bacterium]
NSWTNVLMDNTSGNIWTKEFNIPAGTYEWGIVNQDDLWLVSGENLTFSIDASGNITGQTSYTITYSPAEITFANLQWPGNATIETGQAVPVYAQVLAENINLDPETGYENMSVWIGISNENTNPATWTEWIPAPYSGIGTTTQRPEYSSSIGSTITEAGTYYYASRFSVNIGDYVYGGYNNAGGGFWDGTNNVSGVLTVIDNIVYFPVTFEVTNLNPDNSQIFIKGSFNEWDTVPMDYQGENIWMKTFDITEGTFEWGLVNQNDEWLIQGPNLEFSVSNDGSISGQTSYIIPGQEDTVDVLDRWVIYTANQQQVSISGASFNGGNLGTFTPSVSLYLDGGGIKTQKSGSYDVTGAEISYRIYKDGSAPGEFIISALPFKENLPEEGQQIWENTELDLLISQGLSNGQYFLEIYFTMYYKSSPEGEIQAFIDNNNGDNYKAFFTYDEGIGISNHNNDLNISVFPNPASNKIQLLFPADMSLENYSISDMIGKTWIYEKAPEMNPLVIDVSMLSPGTYFLTVNTKNKTISRKLIIQ